MKLGLAFVGSLRNLRAASALSPPFRVSAGIFRTISSSRRASYREREQERGASLGDPFLVNKENVVDFIRKRKDIFRREFMDDDIFPRFDAKLEELMNVLNVASPLDLHRSFQTKRSETIGMISTAGYNPLTMAADLAVTFRDPEECFDGRMLWVGSRWKDHVLSDVCVPEINDAKDDFVEGALSYDGPDLGEHKGQREADIVIILGPSGSGKSFFALRGLPRPQDSAKAFTVYFRKDDLEDVLTQPMSDKVIAEFRKKIHFRLNRAAPTYSTNERLEMGLTVVLDDAASMKSNAGDYDYLYRLYQEVEKMAQYPRLVLTGNGLDALTLGLNSDSQVRKYRMRPLTLSQVNAIVDSTRFYLSYEVEQVRDLVKDNVMYRSLATNARAAFSLVKKLFRGDSWRDGFGDTGGVVQHVARQYIGKSDALDKLSKEDGRLLVRKVLRILQDSSSRRGEAYLPEIDVGHLELETCAHSLLDFNVDNHKGRHVLLFGSKYAVSMSSSISFVLLALLDVVGCFGLSWSNNNLLAGLNELNEMVMNKEAEALSEHGVELFILRESLPYTDAAPTIKLPPVSSNAVFVNDPRSFFADVIAPYRVCRCKFVHTIDEMETVPLEAEDFTRMGIVQPTSLGPSSLSVASLNGAVLSALYSDWNERSVWTPAAVSRGEVKRVAESDLTTARLFYPMGQLYGEPDQTVPEFTMRDYTYNGETHKLVSDNGGRVFHCKDVLSGIKAAFYTNGKSFAIGAADTLVAVTAEDIALDGRVFSDAKKTAILTVLRTLGVELRAGVELLFYFARDHSENSLLGDENEDDNDNE